MRKLVGLVIVAVFNVMVTQLFAQNKDTAYVSITNFTLNPGTFSWRGTGTFYDMTSWNSSQYTEGHLKQGTQFRMNYRLLYPVGYDANFDPGYPMIVMLHGGGERGNCWNSDCYCDGNCAPNNAPVPDTDPRFLNNDHVLTHGGQPHLTAVNLAGTKKPDDPTLNPRAFPGFVLFPQNENAWGSPSANNSALSYALRIVRLVSKQYNVDPDRIYIHGLSLGGQAVYKALNMADWLFAAAAPMSALVYSNELEYDSVANIPLWAFQGGKDGEPTPGQTETLVRKYREAGGSARYTLYPTLGHGTWNSAYNEPDFFMWLLSKRKSDIHVYYDNPKICGTNGAGAKLGLAQGFLAYQWERDGQIIAGANSNLYVATIPGVYRARFSRLSANPTEQQWNRWSQEVVVSEQMPEQANLDQVGSVVLQDLNGLNTVNLKTSDEAAYYYWYKNGTLTTLASAPTATFNAGSCTTLPCVNEGAYTLVTAGFDKCPSPPSQTKYVFFTGHAPTTIPKPTNFAAKLTGATSILLTWSDASSQERNYEIWRRRSTDASGNGWTMVTLTDEDITSYHDTGLEPNVQYWYKIRAVSNVARSTYAPGDNKASATAAQNLIISTVSDVTPPTAPQNLTAVQSDINIANKTNSVTLTWEPSTDDGTVSQYLVSYGSITDSTKSNQTSYTVNGLAVNGVYNFTVRAIDLANNVSQPSNQATANTYVDGLFYEHSTGAWANLTAVSFANAEFKGKVSQFTLSPATQDDFYNFRFYGYIYINTGGTYRFRLEANDGAQLYIDGVSRITRNGPTTDGTCGSSEANVTMSNAGFYTIEVRYFESTGSECLNVLYRGTDTNNSFVTIPANKLKSYNISTPPTPPIAPANLIATTASMTQIDLAWDYDGRTENGTKVVILGSSTAVGTGASPISNSWVNLLTTWLSSVDSSSTVTNLAVGGYDSRDVIPSGDASHNITYALSLNPDLIIVNLPSNDVANSVPLTTTMNNLRTIKSLADAQNVKILFTTTQPRNFTNDAAGTTKRNLLDTSADSIRAEFGADVIDIYDELTDFNNSKRIKASYNFDGTHVNNAGHAYIYTMVRDMVIPYLEFEVVRSTSASGPFAIVGRTAALSYSDTSLLPGTTYYYKVRAASAQGTSDYSNVANATTLFDNIAPTQPTGLTVTGTTYTNVALTWTQSTDNTKVIGYEIWANGVKIGTSSIPGYQATDLTPNTAYSFYVVAYDANDNKSTASNTVNTVTSTPDIYYSKASGNLNDVASWGKASDGSGAAPSSFDNNGQYLVVSNRSSSSLGGSWSVHGPLSKVVVPAGTTLTIDNAFVGHVEVQGGGAMDISYNSVPEMVNLAPTSTVTYNAAASFVQQNTYGNLTLNGAGYKTFGSGTTTVLGNLTTGNGVALKGASGNATTIALSGDLTIDGTPGFTPPDFGVLLACNKNGTQTITTSGALALYSIKTTGTASVNLVNGGTPVTFDFGSLAGGGLSLGNGTTLHAGNNNLSLSNAATINGNGETGKIAINGGDITFASTAGVNSNLYFDATNNSVKRLQLNVTGAGDVLARSAVKVTEAIKIQNGELNSGGFITLTSTATQTANIEQIENSGVITGDVNVQRYITAKPKVYRYISTAVEGTTVADWQAFFTINGPFTGGSAGNASVFIYEPSGWVGYPPSGGSNQDPIVKGRGYSAYMRNTTPFTLETTGNPYQGNVTYSLFPGTGGDDGWNLVGNPYASTIAWSADTQAWIRSAGNINTTISVPENLNATTIQFRVYDYLTGSGTLPGGKIAPGQAFWIQTTGANPTVTITEKAKVAEQQTHYRESVTPEVLRVNLSRGDRQDAAFIAFTKTGTDGLDAQFDGIKKLNVGMFNLSSLPSSADATPLSINNSSDEFCSKNIRLNLQNVTSASDYTLSFENVQTLVGIKHITLQDNYADTVVNVSDATVYSFKVDANVNSFGPDRFVLTFTRPALDLTGEIQAATICGDEEASVTLTGSQPGVAYSVLNKNGTIISDVITGTGGNLHFTIPKEYLTPGENLVKMRADFTGCSQAILPASATLIYVERPTTTTEPYISVCQGTQATLSASGAPEGGYYQWFDEEDREIAGASSASFATPIIKSEAQYAVVAVHANGCAGSKQFITVVPETVDLPAITLVNDTLQAHSNGNLQWFIDGEVVAGENSDAIKPNTSGIYTITSTLGGCTLTSEPYEFIILGTEVGGSQGHSILSLYPNPAPTHNIRIKVLSSDHEAVQVRLIDLMSKTLFTNTLEPSTSREGVTLPIREPLADGIYFVIAQQGEKVQKLKVIIKN